MKPITCPQCLATLPSRAKLCTRCGHAVPAVVEPDVARASEDAPIGVAPPAGPAGLATPSTIGAAALVALAILATVLYASC